jgi:queuine tRNA-ribosyltransferase
LAEDGRQQPFAFTLVRHDGRARAGVLSTPHSNVPTPAFMPVATQASVKSLTPDEVRALGARMILANAYHLALRPGVETVAAMGGLHAYMRWGGPILTDSGGFQAFSLGALRKVTDEGVQFTSHLDGARLMLTPELAMRQQLALGADIAMCLDECIAAGASESAARAAMERTHRWALACKAAHESLTPSLFLRSAQGQAHRERAQGVVSLSARSEPLALERSEGFVEGRPAGRETSVQLTTSQTPPGREPEHQALFGIVQGGAHLNLREESARAIASIGFDGCAVGGVSVGEPKDVFYNVARFTAPLLPENKPRYLMGVGSPEDLVECVAAGYDLFDCALPTRVARNGGLYTRSGRVDITSPRFRVERGPLEDGCDCAACAGYSAAYVHHLFRARELLAYRLATIHNLRFYQRLMEELRQAIQGGALDAYRRAFHARYVPASEDARLDQRERWGKRRGLRSQPPEAE